MSSSGSNTAPSSTGNGDASGSVRRSNSGSTRQRLDTLSPRAPPSSASPASRAVAPKVSIKPKAFVRNRRSAGQSGAGNSSSSSSSPQVKSESGSGEYDSSSPSLARLRGAEGKRSGPRSRPEVPLTATGIFSAGPAPSGAAPPMSRARNSGGPRAKDIPTTEKDLAGAVPTAEAASQITTAAASPAASRRRAIKSENKQAATDDRFAEDNYDELGEPMRDMATMAADADPRWEPVSLNREVKKAELGDALPIAAPPGQGEQLIKLEQQDLESGKIIKIEEHADGIDVQMTDIVDTTSIPASQQSGGTSTVDASTKDGDEDEDDDDEIALPSGKASGMTNDIDTNDKSPATNDGDIAMSGVTDTKTERRRSSAAQRQHRNRRSESRPIQLTKEELEEHNRTMFDLEELRNLLEDAGHGDDALQNLVLFQLPDVLPVWQPLAESAAEIEPVKEEKVESLSSGDATLQNSEQEPIKIEDEAGSVPITKPKRRKKARPTAFPPPEGHIGKLNFHKSGRVTCDWGNLRCDVGVGAASQVVQEAVNLETGPRKATVIGTVATKIVLTPNIDKLLRQEVEDKRGDQEANTIDV
ncbi:hypothetical protein PYCC9005_004433 [Savitreella phatthalungensis]